jgi:hypothetical protein
MNERAGYFTRRRGVAWVDAGVVVGVAAGGASLVFGFSPRAARPSAVGVTHIRFGV